MIDVRRFAAIGVLLAASAPSACGSSSTGAKGGEGEPDATTATDAATTIDAEQGAEAAAMDATTPAQDAETQDAPQDAPTQVDASEDAYDGARSGDAGVDAALEAALDAQGDAQDGAASSGDASTVLTVGCSGSTYTSIEAAVQDAPANAEIDICAGTYAEQVRIVGKSLTLVGTSGSALTILDATGLDDGISINQAISGTAVDLSVSITGLTVRNASEAGVSAAYANAVDLHDVHVEGCSQGIDALGTGPEVSLELGIYDSVIDQNGGSTDIGSLYGAGIEAQYVDLHVERTQISDNTLSRTASSGDNTSSGMGGAGIYVVGNLTLIDSTVENNSIHDTLGRFSSTLAAGAGIAVKDLSPLGVTISGSTIQGNAVVSSARAVGGAGLADFGVTFGEATLLRIDGTSFLSNMSTNPLDGGTASGGSIYVPAHDDVVTDLSNVTFSMNSPSDIYLLGNSVTPSSPATLYCPGNGGACTSICVSSCIPGVRCAASNACASGVCTNGACP